MTNRNIKVSVVYCDNLQIDIMRKIFFYTLLSGFLLSSAAVQADEVDFEKLLQSMKLEAGTESGVLGENPAPMSPSSAQPQPSGANPSLPAHLNVSLGASVQNRAVDPGFR